MTRLLDRLRAQARSLKRQTYTLYFVMRDPRTPWYARALAAIVVGYVLSPIDLIPDFVPVFGLLDDLILVPVGIALVLRLVPAQVLADCSQRAEGQLERKVSRLGAAIIVSIWLIAVAWIAVLVRGLIV